MAFNDMPQAPATGTYTTITFDNGVVVTIATPSRDPGPLDMPVTTDYMSGDPAASAKSLIRLIEALSKYPGIALPRMIRDLTAELPPTIYGRDSLLNLAVDPAQSVRTTKLTSNSDVDFGSQSHRDVCGVDHSAPDTGPYSPRLENRPGMAVYDPDFKIPDGL